ncbi:acyltransferase family protein [Komagataeibacter oboediens]|uniref:acyltransferase family protein n=1 Tax=Komagataeibacter oboediens TaxID=65958 RepID=UPI000237D7F7|nr:acyltransferase family protein [Komagataeibacter oboediens]
MSLNLHADYRRDIDGLRAIAVTAVVLFHANLYPVQSGFVGVDIFFVISGFLIGGIVYRDVSLGTFSFLGFYARRARRILPALMLTVICVMLLGLLLSSPTELRQNSLGAISALLGWSNVLLWKQISYFSPDAHLNPFLMTWSLGVEEQFYLFFPLLILAFRQLRGIYVLCMLGALCIGSLCIAQIGVGRWPAAAFYLLPTRAWELGMGTFLAVAKSNYTLSFPRPVNHFIGWMGLFLIGLSIFVFDEHTPFPGIAALLPVGGTLALLLSDGSFVNRAILSTRPFIWIGRISYSWYLWHWPLMAFIWVCSPQPPAPLLLLGAGIVSLFPAVLSWRYIEQPFRRGGGADGGVVLRYGGALALGVGMLATVYVADGLPRRFDRSLMLTEQVLAEGRGEACLANYGVSKPNVSPRCVHDAGRPRIALLGDSHASALAASLSHLADQAGFDFVQFTKSSCPPLLGTARLMPSHPGHAAQCALYNDRAFAAVMRDPRVQTVVLAGYWAAPFAADAGGDAYIDPRDRMNHGVAASLARLDVAVRTTTQVLARAHRHVIILGDVPQFRFDPAREAVTAFMPVRQHVAHMLDPSFLTAGDIAPVPLLSVPGQPIADTVRHAVADTADVTYFSLADGLCSPAGCKFRTGNDPFYVDQQHLSRGGADFLLARIDGLLPVTGDNVARIATQPPIPTAPMPLSAATQVAIH